MRCILRLKSEEEVDTEFQAVREEKLTQGKHDQRPQAYVPGTLWCLDDWSYKD
jgi:hypothetical protein